MKNITSKVQRLSQRAAELRQAIESVPPKISEMRGALSAATGQVQKLRADILSNVATLRAETDTQLIAALREIDDNADVLAQAGCLLERADMDLGPTRRVTVNLERVENVDAPTLNHLIAVNTQRPVIHAILQAIAKADQLSEQVELKELTFTKLAIDVGLIPSVRVGWTTNDVRRRIVTTGPAVPVMPQPVVSAPLSPFGQGGFFERRETPVVAHAPVILTPAAEVIAHPPAPAVAAATGAIQSATVQQVAQTSQPLTALGERHARASALDRFKKMPDLSKRAH